MAKPVVLQLGVISYLLKNSGSVAIIGAESFPLLQRTALNEWKNRFTSVVPWDHLTKPNPLIIKKPTQNAKDVLFANGSIARLYPFY